MNGGNLPIFDPSQPPGRCVRRNGSVLIVGTIQMIDFFHAAREAFHANRLVLSKAFVSRYEEMNRALGDADNPNLLPPQASEIAASVMQRMMPEMEEVALRELGLDYST